MHRLLGLLVDLPVQVLLVYRMQSMYCDNLHWSLQHILQLYRSVLSLLSCVTRRSQRALHCWRCCGEPLRASECSTMWKMRRTTEDLRVQYNVEDVEDHWGPQSAVQRVRCGEPVRICAEHSSWQCQQASNSDIRHNCRTLTKKSIYNQFAKPEIAKLHFNECICLFLTMNTFLVELNEAIYNFWTKMSFSQ